MRHRHFSEFITHPWPRVALTAMAELAKALEDNCVEEGECLLWTGLCNANGNPRMRNKSLRRLVWEAVHGEVTGDKLVIAGCDNTNCLNHAHLKLATKGEVLLRTYATTDLAMRRAITAARITRAQPQKLTMEVAREIRGSAESIDVLAERHGVNRTRISQIRRGVAWREFSSPFFGLGAR